MHPIRKKPVIRTLDELDETEVGNARGARIAIALGEDDGVPNFVMRRFTIEPGGRIPTHRHSDIEHEQVVLEGEMVLGLGDETVTVRSGQCVFIPAGVSHWYENRGHDPVRFLCLIPRTDGHSTEWLEPAEDRG